ncbi:PREDICTED: uncharacterized protein LOC106115858 [Papilio xuthus]|uniref:Uncharacterized protein LOC106115858 n=1 Tax=Papilio xuthus TaxID=66420 RepID=A0AAJ7E6G8_PAPXU|nr:PREDICTED: uncharacterized protein LOC106115858 [Papilio xuthus]
MDGLIRELSGTGIGCSLDGTMINNISYADDMVLLSPSLSGLRKLISICECYAEAQGLKYNSTKSEVMIFKAGSKTYDIPPVILNNHPLKRVEKVKYLGHWVTVTLNDDLYIERERRALSVRANMLARRFAQCTKPVKITLFKAYCQSLYTCSLWVKRSQRDYNALRVQYNNGFRALLGLPRFCSASGMFADAGVDGFAALIRKRAASLMRRVRDSANSYLQLIADRVGLDCPVLAMWTRLHVI